MTIELKKPEAIFFDWDGTLIDSFAFLQDGHNYVLEILAMPLFENNEFGEYFGKPREEIYHSVYGEKAAIAQAHFEKFVIANHKQRLKPMNGAGKLLKTIKNLGVIAGVVSNKRSDFILGEIESFGWGGCFSSVVGAGDAQSDKPDSAPLLLAIERAGVDFDVDKIWYVGDTETDLLCAQNARCKFIYVAHEGLNHDWVDKYNPAMIVKNCLELKRILDESLVIHY